MDAMQIDFCNEQQRNAENDKINQLTHGSITNFLEPFDQSTKLLLLNKMSFKADWLKTFNLKDTELRPFYASSGVEYPTEMMIMNITYNGNAKELLFDYVSREDCS